MILKLFIIPCFTFDFYYLCSVPRIRIFSFDRKEQNCESDALFLCRIFLFKKKYIYSNQNQSRMEPFLPFIKVTQSADAATLTLTDFSNYSTNTDGVTDDNVVNRTILVYDAYNVLQGTISMLKDTPATFAITKDQELRFNLSWSLSSGDPFVNDVKFLSTAFYNNIQLSLAPQIKCSCPPPRLMEHMNKATEFYNAAIDAFILGDDISATLNITDCNTYINYAAKC